VGGRKAGRGGRKEESRAHLGGSDSDLGTSVDVNSTVGLSGDGGSDCGDAKAGSAQSFVTGERRGETRRDEPVLTTPS